MAPKWRQVWVAFVGGLWVVQWPGAATKPSHISSAANVARRVNNSLCATSALRRTELSPSLSLSLSLGWHLSFRI